MKNTIDNPACRRYNTNKPITIVGLYLERRAGRYEVPVRAASQKQLPLRTNASLPDCLFIRGFRRAQVQSKARIRGLWTLAAVRERGSPRFFAMQKHSKNKMRHFLAPLGQPNMMRKNCMRSGFCPRSWRAVLRMKFCVHINNSVKKQT